MNKVVLALALLLVTGPVAVPSTAQSRVKFDAQALEAAWNQAHLAADTAALDALWAPDISIVVPGMNPLNKVDALAMWKAMPVKFTVYDSSNVRARIEGTVAVVTGTITRARTFGGRSAQERWNFTKVYRRSESSWQVFAFHASNTPD